VSQLISPTGGAAPDDRDPTSEREACLLGAIETLLALHGEHVPVWEDRAHLAEDRADLAEDRATVAETRAELAEQESEQLQRAMQSRAAIEQAKGILMQRHGIDAEHAFALLRQASMEYNVKLHVIAERLVDEASGGGEILEATGA
jgi:hypothetical protein